MSIRDNLDISAYLVLGPENTLGRPVGDVVAQALDAGFTCIQVRSKVASAREIIALTGDAAQAIAQAGKTGQVALLIDDRLDCVLAAREQGIAVDGVHVGQSDIPVEVCRKLLGPDAIVGAWRPGGEVRGGGNTAAHEHGASQGKGPHPPTPPSPWFLDDSASQLLIRSIRC